MKTRAAVLRKIGNDRPYNETKPIKIEELELEDPARGEVMIKVKAAGLCHSDLSVINGNRPWPVPIVLGHEAAGIVVKLGEGVDRFEVGDHVVFSFKPSCGHCEHCESGRPALCIPGSAANNAGTLLDGGQRFHNGEETLHHHLGVSGFSEYTVASEYSIVKIDKDYPFEVAALFGCAIMTGVGAVVNTGSIKAGESVLVVGLGGVGLSAIIGAKSAGASKIIAADINEDKFELAQELGAEKVINSSNENAMAEVKEYTQGGVNLAVEFAGAIPALDFAFNATRSGGRAVTGALPRPGSRLSLDPIALVGLEKTLKGCYLGSCVPSRDIPNYLQLYKMGRLPVDKLITDRITLDEINEGFEKLALGKEIRQIIVFD